MMAGEESEAAARLAITRLMLDHVLAANQLFSKYQFGSASPVQFVLTGYRIDTDSQV